MEVARRRRKIPKKKRRSFSRPLGERRYKKMFLLSVEGEKTEQQYFNMFNDRDSLVHVRCLSKRNKNAPRQALKVIERHIKKEGLRKNDEAWIVVDSDQWIDEQLKELFEWSKRKPNFYFALSNPKFEYWLLLHFEDPGGVSFRECSEKLKRYIPDYDKGIEARHFPEKKIREAIERAKQKDSPQCEMWPVTTGTTVYRLVENILITKEKL